MDFTRNIKKGMSGADVRAVKDRLFALGFYSLKVTAITKDTLGSDSVDAIKRFQLKNGLKADGIVGRLTWSALFGVPSESTGGAEVGSTVLDEIERLCKEQVDNGSIYVWASSGELGINVTEAWIQTKENRNNGGANFERARRLWAKRIESGNTVFRCFDCSGFVSWILSKAGVTSGRRDCDRLFALCDRIGEPVNGALLFRVNSDNSEDETHVGLYFRGYQYHAKGRDVGVVREPYKASYWHKIGWFKALPKE